MAAGRAPRRFLRPHPRQASRRWAALAPWALSLVLISACNATQARIDDNEDLYNSYSPEAQALIKSNRIGNGFDTTQVYLALGNADRTEQVDGAEVWYFNKTHTDTIKEEKSAGEYRDDMDAYKVALAQGRKPTAPSTHRTVKLYRSRVERVVRFENGVVAGWEEPEEQWLDEWHR